MNIILTVDELELLLSFGVSTIEDVINSLEDEGEEDGVKDGLYDKLITLQDERYKGL